MKIKEIDGNGWIMVTDAGCWYSDHLHTLEEAEKCLAEYQLSCQLRESLFDCITEWSERKAAELVMTPEQILAHVAGVGVNDYGLLEE